MSRFLDFDQPIFFTPPSGKESGPRRLFKGGGGSSGTPYYAQQDRLFGAQADISQQLYNQYASLAPTYLSNTQGMVDDAMDGTLANQMRQKAGNDAAAANANALASTNRNMQRMGANFSTDRMLSEMNKSSIMGAANTAGTLNNATAAAEDMKWNRNAGAYGQIAGMGTGAMAGMGSAGAGYGNMAAQSNANSMANAQGFGKFGSAIAGIGMGYAKGGEVKCNKFASGAYVRKPFVNHLKPIDWRNMPVTEQGGGSGVGSAIGSVAMGAAPIILGSLAKDIWLGDKDKHGLYSGGLRDDFRKWSKDTFGSSKKESPVTVSNSDESLINGIVDQDQSASMAAQRSALDGAVENAARDGQSDTSAYGPATSAFKFDDLSTPKASPSVDGMIKSVTAQNAPIQDGAKAFVDQGEAAAKELARQQAEEESRRIAAEQAAQAARGGFIKRGVKMATGGFAQQIDSGSFESDPDKFKAKPLTAAEQVAQRAGAGLMATATNPLTYKRGYDKYQQILAKEAKNKSFVDSKPETPGVAETSPVEAPAQVQEVPLQEQAMSPQQEFSQAFNEATAPQQSAPIDTQAQASEPAPAVGEAPAQDAPVADGAAPVVDGAAPSIDGATAATEGAAPVADGAASADTSFISSAAETPGVAEVAPVADMGANVAETALTEGTGAAATTEVAGSAMDGAGAAVPVVKGLADIASGRDAGEAVADAAAGYAGAKGGAALGTAVMPGVGTVVGGVLGGVLGGSIFADGGEVDASLQPVQATSTTEDPYAQTKGEDELDLWDRMKRNAQRGPGDDVLHMTGMHQSGELNTMQKLASANGDPIGVMVFKAEGGDVEREDFTPGGDVRGQGTETSDDIPAWLSDGEIVHNAEAVKLAGKDALLEINDAGLEVRDGKATPEEAQAKIGQVMIQRGKELTGGSRFMKRGVKLAGGGFLGGNLGIAMGAGVDQYNIQSARSDQRDRFDKMYDLQKENNDRLNRIAEQQAVEFENKQKDRADTQALKTNIVGIANKHQTIGKDADQYIAKETEANAAAAKEAGVEYQPLTAEQQAVIKQSVSKTPEQEYIEAFRGAGQLDAATAMEGKRDLKEVGEKVSAATEDPVLQAIAKTNPLEAAKLHVGEVNLKERLEASERNNMLRMQNMLELADRRNAARAAGSGSGSGSGGGLKKDGTPANYIDRLVWTDKLNKDRPPEIADAAHSFYAQMYSEAMRKNGGVSDVDNSEMVRIANEAATAKTAPMLHYDAENMAYRYGFSDKGNNQRYLRFEASGDTLNTQTQKPFFDKKAKDVNEMKSLKLWAKKDPELYRQAFTAASGGDQLDKMIRGREALESALKVGFADEATQRQAITQFGALDKAIRLAVILRNHPDWMENATNPDANGSPSTSTWYSGDYPTNITNDEGSPNTIANGINATRNWFAEQGRKAQGVGEWGTQRKW